MKKTLFINACVRPESRTRMLAQHALDRMGGEITEVDLGKENIEPLRLELLELRNALQEKEIFPMRCFVMQRLLPRRMRSLSRRRSGIWRSRRFCGIT